MRTAVVDCGGVSTLTTTPVRIPSCQTLADVHGERWLRFFGHEIRATYVDELLCRNGRDAD